VCVCVALMARAKGCSGRGVVAVWYCGSTIDTWVYTSAGCSGKRKRFGVGEQLKYIVLL